LSQEPYRWDTVAESARTAIKARYHLLPYWLSLFADAANYGTPVIRALFYEFDDPIYAEVDEQFMVGDSLLVSPVLRPNATSVQAYLPYHGNTKWRNWFTHEEIAGSVDKVTLDAPLSTIPVYIRSGSVLLIHRDTGYTLTETRQSPFSLLVYLDGNNYADGCTKIDDGISYPGKHGIRVVTICLTSCFTVVDQASLTFTASGTGLKIAHDQVKGNHQVDQPIAQVVILGVDAQPSSLSYNDKALDGLTMQYDGSLKKLVIDGLNVSLNDGGELKWS
jgi:alpha-glucosidase